MKIDLHRIHPGGADVFVEETEVTFKNTSQSRKSPTNIFAHIKVATSHAHIIMTVAAALF
jgi:hypothetical protein